MHHSSVLASLQHSGVELDFVRFLANLYRRQHAYVCLSRDCKSRLFEILRGVQGDPISPVLFNNVTRMVFSSLRGKWSREGIGTMVCGSDALLSTHAMFADDTTLFASNKADLVAMIRDVMEALVVHGLNLSTEKCLVQTACK